MGYNHGPRTSRDPYGFTLVELMIAVAIVAVLAAVAIPVFRGYAKEARMSEARTNIQGILEAEEAYFTRFGHYTGPLPLCPPAAAPNATNQVWDVSACDQGWDELGWSPDGPVYFQYRVWSLYDDQGVRTHAPPSPGVTVDNDAFAIDWATEIGNDLATMQPWVAVQACADTDGMDANGDGESQVCFGGNSYNNRIYRSADDEY